MPLGRLRAVPWILVFEAVMVARDRWARLTPDERRRLVGIAKASGGRPARVNPEDRREVRRLAGKLDLPGVVRDVAPLGRKLRRRR